MSASSEKTSLSIGNTKAVQLTFCIPTYNNVNSLIRLVSEILQCPDGDIEVVVLDNGSTDATIVELNKISDQRLHVYSNGENIGALCNMVGVLEKGTGEFLVYSTDHDHVDTTLIREFKDFLVANKNLACGYCLFPSDLPYTRYSFRIGLESVKRIAYTGRHPTGYFFRRQYLEKTQLSSRFSDYDFVDLFPLEFAMAEMCLLGTGAIFPKTIFQPETGTLVSKRKSSTTRGASHKAFFSPQSRLKMAVNYSRHLTTLNLSLAVKLYLSSRLFLHGFLGATLGYRSIIRNEALCQRYGMDKRYITPSQTYGTGMDFTINYTQRISSSQNREAKWLVWYVPAFTLLAYLLLTFRLLNEMKKRPKKNARAENK